MGQKVNPIGMRLQVNRTWDSRWFAESKDYGNLLLEDLKMRAFVHEDCKAAGISKVIIERPHKKCRVTIYTARPGVIIGKKGADIETLRKKLAVFTKSELHLNIVEVRKPELDAQLVAESIAQQMERRVSFRRAMKRGVQNAMRIGALGIRVNVSGRLGGAEIARTEWYREGRVPLHTLRADIDYGFSEAKTTYGVIGVKVWVYKGDTLGRNEAPTAETPAADREDRRPRRTERPAGDRPGPGRGPARRPPSGGAGATRRTAEAKPDAAPAATPDAPQVDAAKPAVKRVRKTAVKTDAPAKSGGKDGE
jgi:small subunit ribosomal protein S3